LILALVILLCILRDRQGNEKSLYVFIKIGNNGTAERVKCLNLPGAFYVYTFSAKRQLQFLDVQICPPKLLLRWNDFVVRQILLHKEYCLPKLVTISLWQAIKIKRILGNAHYTVTLLEQGNAYRKIHFNNTQLETFTDDLAVSVYNPIQTASIGIPVVGQAEWSMEMSRQLRVYPQFEEA